MKLNRLRARKLNRALAVTTVAALLIGVPVAGAFADTQSSTNSTAGKDPLKVVVGETVAVTTDQTGNLSPLNLYLINGQVSGQGTGTVQIPTGNGGYKTEDVNNSSGEVSNFFSLAGSYHGNLPVTAKTELTVNGKTVDPNQGYNLTGDVVIKYVVTNHTSRQQEISYTNIYGSKQKKTVNIPVPFGDSYSVTFGQGWDITDPGTMSMKTTPTGTALSATLVLFPVGPALGTTQSVTIKATADNATLPATTHTVVPVPLNVYEGGLALKAIPAIENALLPPVNSILTGATNELISAANLLSGFTGGFESLDTNYINPLVADIDKLYVNPASLSKKLQNLTDGLDELGGLLAVDSAAKNAIAALFVKLSKFVEVNLEDLVKWLGQFLTSVAPSATEASTALTGLNSVLGSVNPTDLTAATRTMKQACDSVGPTSQYYGYPGLPVPLVGPYGGGDGANALNKGISNGTPLIGKPKPYVATLKTLKAQLDAQAAGTLLPEDLYLAATLLPILPSIPTALIPAKYQDIIKKIENIPPEIQAALEAFLVQPGCKPTVTFADDVFVPLSKAWGKVGPDVAKLAGALEALAKLAASPNAAKVYNTALVDLGKLGSVLSNPGCTTADLFNPIQSALKTYGAAGIKAHIGDVLKQIFSKCGLAQIVTFFGDFDAVLGKSLVKLGAIVNSAQKDVPKIAGGVTKLKDIANLVGKVFDEIPAVGQEVADKIIGGADTIDSKGTTAIGAISDAAAQVQASLLAMNERGLAGDGAPYGNAKGPNTSTISAYQITVAPATPNTRNWTTSIVVAAVFLVLALGLGTFLYRRRIRP